MFIFIAYYMCIVDIECMLMPWRNGLWTLSPYHQKIDSEYRIVSNKRPGGVAIFQKGMFLRGKFSMQKCSV